MHGHMNLNKHIIWHDSLGMYGQRDVIEWLKLGKFLCLFLDLALRFKTFNLSYHLFI